MVYEYLPDEVRKLIGKDSERRQAPIAVERGFIDHWVEALEDSNPIYYDEDEARKAGYGTIVAPPGMLLVWVGPYHWTPRRGPLNWVEEGILHGRLKQLMNRPVGIIQKIEIEYLKPVYLGDHLNTRDRVIDVTPEKKLKLGVGNFWVIESIYANQNGEDVAIKRLTGCGYTPKADSDNIM